MIDRTWKVLLAVGLVIGVCAITIALIGGSHFKWTSGERAPSVDIQIGSDGGMTVAEMGAVAIIALILGAVFLAMSRQKGAGKSNISAGSTDSFSFMAFIQNLRKSARDCKVGGVCGGLGEHSPIPSWIWRMFFLLLLLCFGSGLLAYIVLWICMPAALEPETAQRSDANKAPEPSVAPAAQVQR